MIENKPFTTKEMTQVAEITSMDTLDTIDKLSTSQVVFVMKHSTRCGFSHAALEEVIAFKNDYPEVPVYILDLLAYRSISDKMTSRYGKPHHSPQVLVIKNGATMTHATHYGIDGRWLKKAYLSF